MLHLLPFCLLLTFALVSSSNVLVDTRDVTLAISEDAANSAGSVYTTAGKLDFSGKLPDNTTTAKLKKLIPQAYALCPDCPINFRVYATEPPRATFRTANGATLQVQNAKLNLTAAAVAAGSPVSELMVLAVNASCGLNFTNNPASSGDYIKPSITIVQIHLIVDSSNVGVLASAAVALLGPLVDTFLKNVVIPEFNKMFPVRQKANVSILFLSGTTLFFLCARDYSLLLPGTTCKLNKQFIISHGPHLSPLPSTGFSFTDRQRLYDHGFFNHHQRRLHWCWFRHCTSSTNSINSTNNITSTTRSTRNTDETCIGGGKPTRFYRSWCRRHHRWARLTKDFERSHSNDCQRSQWHCDSSHEWQGVRH